MVHDATQADLKIQTCLDENRSFAVIAGAGSGKTTSLVKALRYLKGTYGKRLRRDGNKVVCITYTKRARDVLKHKLNDESLFEISTIHSFLWGELMGPHELALPVGAEGYTSEAHKAITD